MDTDVLAAGTSARARRRRILVGAAAVCLLVGVVAVLLTSRDDERSTVDAGVVGDGDDAEGSASGWTRLPDPPLSPRVGASAAILAISLFTTVSMESSDAPRLAVTLICIIPASSRDC